WRGHRREARALPPDLVPTERPACVLPEYGDVPLVAGARDAELRAPCQRGDGAGGVDPERIAEQGRLLESGAASEEGARARRRQRGEEYRMLGREVLEEQALAGLEEVTLLIGRRDVEERGVEGLWQRNVLEGAWRVARREVAELAVACGPLRSNGSETDR